MRKIFLVSFDRSSDRILNHIVALLKGTPFPLFHRTTDMNIFGKIEPSIPVWKEEPPDNDKVIGEDRAIYNSLSGKRDVPGANVNPHLLKPDEINTLEEMTDNVERGDLVLSFIDVSSKNMTMNASYFSSLVISKEAFSLCFITAKERFREIKNIETLNRELLDLSMNYDGIAALSPKVTKAGRYIDIAHILRHLSEMTFRSGVINLDQADLLSTSKGGSILVMTWGAAQPGGDPATTSIKDALSNPLCDIDLSTVRKALVNVTGSRELTLEDSLVASEVLKDRVREDARIIWGVNIMQEIGDDMEVFMILSTTPMELLLHWYSGQ